MATWERDRSTPNGPSLLFPMAWSPLFWLCAGIGEMFRFEEATVVFVGLGAVATGYPLFVLSEARPLVQQKARFGIAALAGLLLLCLLAPSIPPWAFASSGLAMWILGARTVRSGLSMPRWRALVEVDTLALGPEWRRHEGLGGGFVRVLEGTQGLLSVIGATHVLDLTGPHEEALTPVEFGLDDHEEA